MQILSSLGSMADTTGVRNPNDPDHDELWFRHHVLTRFFAAVWWIAMALMTFSVAWAWGRLAWDRSWGGLIGVAIAMVIAIPVAKEWPHWRRMGRMLRHGT